MVPPIFQQLKQTGVEMDLFHLSRQFRQLAAVVVVLAAVLTLMALVVVLAAVLLLVALLVLGLLAGIMVVQGLLGRHMDAEAVVVLEVPELAERHLPEGMEELEYPHP
jgi:predicted ferric reductase